MYLNLRNLPPALVTQNLQEPMTEVGSMDDALRDCRGLAGLGEEESIADGMVELRGNKKKRRRWDERNDDGGIIKRELGVEKNQKKTRKQPSRHAGNDTVMIENMVEDVEEETNDADDTKLEATSSENSNKVVAIEIDQTPIADKLEDKEDDDEVEVVVVEKKMLKNPPYAAAVSEGVLDEDAIQILGSTGENALTDFPHSREHCLVHPQSIDPTLHCPKCFCYVCDVNVTACSSWEEHCHANCSDSKWKRARATRAAALSKAQNASQNHRMSVKELFESVVRIYPNEVTPPHLFTTKLHHYQKQSLAFLLDIEQHQTSGQKVKSGWLCSEVGMGKSAVVIALVAANPMPEKQQPSLDDIKLRQKGKRIKVKATVLFAPVTLLGQWEDEIKKHAPSLKVCRHHPTSRMKSANLVDADIVITTATFKWASVFTSSFEFHRLVFDESHLIGSLSARKEYLLAFKSERNLCVTATPFSTSLQDLNRQIEFLGLSGEKNRLSDEEFLKRYMIRHLKSQVIDGAPALALPKATTTTKIIPMTYWERNTFNDTVREKGQRPLDRPKIKTRILEMSWYAALTKPMMCEDSSKVELLKTDLKELLKREPNMRVVVYTQFLEQQKYAKKAIQSMGIRLYTFNGSLASHLRDKYIRDFQSLAEPGPAVFLVTIKTGSVGITLTAASRVILLEPCIDPATEHQAAGRIHRLGQTKQVGVTRYVFEDSCESNILKLHDKIEKGEIEFAAGELPRAATSILQVSPGLVSSAWRAERAKQQQAKRIAQEAELKSLLEITMKVQGKTVEANVAERGRRKRIPVAVSANSATTAKKASTICCQETCKNTAAESCTNNSCSLCCRAQGSLSCQRHEKQKGNTRQI